MDKTLYNQIVSLRHTLHAHPELSMQETETKRRIMLFLQTFSSFQVVDRGSWFFAVKRGTSEDADRIAFRADMDALPMDESLDLPYASCNPGVSHKCGHDGHMAAVCALAAELDPLILEKTVYLIFQPGEETGTGARQCCTLIREEDIREIYAFHNLSGYPEGMLMYRYGITQPASEGLRLVLTGETSHAAEPEKGNNPSHTIASVALFAERLADQEQKRLLLCTITGMQVGTGDFGISPGQGELCMTLRSDNEKSMKRLEEQILSYAKDLSAAEGLSINCQIQDYFPATENHSQCLEKVLQAASLAGVSAKEMSDMWRPSEDFGYYLQECPGAMFYIGNGEAYPAVHTGSYDFNDRILERVTEIFKNLAVQV